MININVLYVFKNSNFKEVVVGLNLKLFKIGKQITLRDYFQDRPNG